MTGAGELMGGKIQTLGKGPYLPCSARNRCGWRMGGSGTKNPAREGRALAQDFRRLPGGCGGGVGCRACRSASISAGERANNRAHADIY